jgi:hypothetical protein
MAGRAKAKITNRDITGLKSFEKLRPLFERLHEVGCERDTVGSRDRHFDEYCCLVLLFFFNQIVDSLRACNRRRSSNRRGRNSACRAPHGSFAGTRQVCDPKLLRPIIGRG